MIRLRSLAPLLVVCALPISRSATATPTFRNDVMAVLSKGGCNQGICHGNRNGKGGFKLSLRGDDPVADYLSLTRAVSGRRVDFAAPERSLVLLKPTSRVPHEGGKRFAVGSPEFEILRDWIAEGCPSDRPDTPNLEELVVRPPEALIVDPVSEVKLEVEAVFEDGHRRDVSRLAVYETSNTLVTVDAGGLALVAGEGECTVIVRYLDQQVPVRVIRVSNRVVQDWVDPRPVNFIDERVFAKLRRLRLQPAPLADDRTFLRRAYLDAIGLPPTAAEARAFLADERPDRRARLIDGLLERDEFADHWALKWSDLLRVEEKTLDRKGVQAFHEWIRAGIAARKPMDVFVREIIAARGSTYRNPPANFYRALRDPFARSEAAAQLFLGTRLQCARCHNHPFDRWTQDDYYGWAALFGRVRYKVLENRRRDSNDKHEFRGEQIVWVAREGEVTNVRTEQPARPRFLGAEAVVADDAARDRLEALAEWLTSSENPHFARVLVNRIWAELLGKGIVDPVDDFRSTNPPSHPALLDELARDFVAHGFDLRHTVRAIMRSATYQLSSSPQWGSDLGDANFARMAVRRLSAETLNDSFHRVLGVPASFRGYPVGLRAAQLPGVVAVRRRDAKPTPADEFLRLFGKPPRLLTCECERSDEANVSQAFQLISGDLLHELLRTPENRIARLLGEGRSGLEVLDELFWAALARPPGCLEREAYEKTAAETGDRRRALEDVAWALLNAKEFVLRH